MAGVCLLLILRINLSKWLLFSAFIVMPVPFGISLLYRDPTPFHVSANGLYINLLDLCVAGMFLLWLSKRWQSPHDTKPFFWYWPLLVPASLLLLINLASSFSTPYPFFGFSVVFSNLKMLFLFLVVANTFEARSSSATYAVYGILITLAFEGVVGIEQKVLGAIFTSERLGHSATLSMQIGQQIIHRVAGTLDHPNAFAMFLNMLIPIGVYFAWQEPRFWVKVFALGAVLLAVIAEVFSGSRSGWIALVGSLAITAPLWLHRRGQNPIIGMGFVLLAGAIGGGTLFAASSSLRDRLLLDDHGTAEVRYPLMEVADNMITANPLTGVGLNHYTHYMTEYDRTADAIAFTYPYPVHNTFMLVAAETGVPSLLLLLLLFAITLYWCLRAFYRTDGVLMATSLGIFACL